MISEKPSPVHIEDRGEISVIHFTAMASPCEVHLAVPMNNSVEGQTGRSAAHELFMQAAEIATQEAFRIESRFSRYRNDGIVHQINHANGKRVSIDEETYKLLHFAAKCFEVSDGMFDITSGILRRAWKFDGSEFTPDSHLIEELKLLIGWEKVSFDTDSFQMPAGMEIDLGGIGKEYAVDRVAQMLAEEFNIPLLVNFGGDVRVISPLGKIREWNVGIESPESLDQSANAGILGEVRISNGGVATSGDARRYCFMDGRRLSHILNPKTGWPVENSPRSVTVIGLNCLEAGLFSTLAMLQGPDAESFLTSEGIRHHIVR
jgi:thiamine biosynthesis lipoprotein